MALPEIDMQAVDVNGCGANFTWINAVSGVNEKAFDDQVECTDPTLDTAVSSNTRNMGADPLNAMRQDNKDAEA
eukprot:3092773-Pleurochrysis_carterae.AAC.1